jgi:hypothetical protein
MLNLKQKPHCSRGAVRVIARRCGSTGKKVATLPALIRARDSHVGAVVPDVTTLTALATPVSVLPVGILWGGLRGLCYGGCCCGGCHEASNGEERIKVLIYNTTLIQNIKLINNKTTRVGGFIVGLLSKLDQNLYVGISTESLDMFCD